MNSVVIHYQEIALKGRNRPWFIGRLVRNLRHATRDLDVRQVVPRMGRIELVLGSAAAWDAVADRVRHTFGIANFSRAGRAVLDVDALAAAILSDLGDVRPSSFRVSARRADKRFPLTSPQIEREVGGRIKDARGWKVDLSKPDFTIHIQEPNSVKAGELWRSMVTAGFGQASQQPGSDFDSGAALSYLDSTAGLAGHENSAKFKVGTALLPEGPAGFGCCTGGSGLAITNTTPKEKQQAAMKFIAYATGTDTVFWSQNTGYMPVRNAALQSQEMKTFYESHPNFKTTVDQLPKTRPQDSARELVPNGDNIIGKGLERIVANGEAADAVFKDVADQLNNEKQPVLRSLKDLGES